MLKVSVIVPVYNVERYLERCIDSVLNQTYRDFELILVDDGSTDSSGRICDEYGEKDGRIKVIHKENGGVSTARNLALDHVSGDYIMFLDSDDALDLDAVERCVESTEGAKWDIVLFGFHMYSGSDGAEVFQGDTVYSDELIETKEKLNKSFSEYYRKGYLNFITDKIIRSSLIKSSGVRFNSGFDIGGEDGLFILGLLSGVSNIKITSDAFYQYYRRTSESITQLFKPEKFARYHDRTALIYQYMRKENCVDESYIVELLGTYFMWAYESTFHESFRYSLSGRFTYVLKAFRKKDIFEGQASVQREYMSDPSAFSDYCKTSLIALRLFYRKRYLLLAMWNVLSYIRMR